jgi:chromosome partitioning protein
MSKTRIITVTNNKGGVGKTTTTVNLAAGLAALGQRVLVIDADPQANATFALYGAPAPDQTLYQALVLKSHRLSEMIVPSRTAGVDLVPSNIGLSAADIVLAGVAGREKMLARLLRPVSGYDYILLDTPPSLGLMTVNALTAAQEVIIPVGVGTFALLGIKLLEETIAELKENLELEELRILGAVATLFDRTRVAVDTVEALKEHFGARLFATVIPKNKDVEEANSRSISVLAYAPQSKGAQAYQAFTREVLNG